MSRFTTSHALHTSQQPAAFASRRPAAASRLAAAAILVLAPLLAFFPLIAIAAAPQPTSAAPAAPLEPVPEKGVIKLETSRSLLLRAPLDVHRTAVLDSAICEIVQTTPRELTLVGRSAGQTSVTFWFRDPAMSPLTYAVHVAPPAK